ncbi:HrpA-like helicase [Vibrio maritimus]|uniref:HrpA-like helicase n=1 Tax=Vibrio maritimus TaxID=990268 RepID=A0A090T2K5_9VIBR|nr:HrpA-like helicase [Vibrio maritimus]
MENRYCDESNIVFVTPGVALRWYADNQLADFSVVVVDEFHERRWDTDLLVALLKQKQSHRTIITSATIEGEKLASYFDATRLVASGRVYNVEVVHRREDSRQLPDSRHLDSRIKQELELRLDETEGDVLVFLPGRKEIQQVQSALTSLAENRDLMVTPLHASVSDEQRVRAMTVQSKQKVVLATNVAETSLTIPNISLVIDSGLERRNVQRNGQTTLMLTHISKASAAQRSGRAGRVMNGVCVRLYGEHAALEAVTPPELQRESIVEPMLAAAVCGHELASLSFIDIIPEKSLVSAKAQLFELGAIDQQGITEHGLNLAPLPIDAIYADLVTKIRQGH